MRYEMFLREVLPYALDCHEAVAVNAVRNAAIEFCRQSHWLVYETDPQTVIANLARYDVDVPSATTVAQVLEVWADERRMVAKSAEELAGMFGRDWREREGQPSYYTQLTPDELILAPRPMHKLKEPLRMIVALQPARSANECDDSLYEWWLEPIAHGARARLYQTPGQPYTNPDGVAYCLGVFNSGVQDAKRRRMQGLGRGPTHVKLPRW